MARLNKWDVQHLQNVAHYTRQINDLYRTLTQEAAAIGASVSNFNPDKPFSFADYPQTKIRLDNLLSSLQSNVQTIIVDGVAAEWTLSNNKNNELARQVFGNNIGKLSQSQYRAYFSTNDAARQAFLARKTAGLTISDRVWRYSSQFKDEIELGLDIGIRNGIPADQLARELRQYLQQPENLFRRVRDEHGQLQLSKNAKAYNPGAGVYRSSQKNAERLARTETNMSYREADYERWQRFTFIVGFEIRRSNNPYPCPMCEALVGKYPKSFKFSGWHPQCRCVAVPIMKTPEELAEESKQILNGEKTSTKSVNEVTEMPKQFKKWVKDNETRLVAANNKGTLPLFLKENRSVWRDYTSIEVINQQAISNTTQYANLFNTKSDNIAEKLGASVTPVNIKSERRILEKAIKDYHGDVSKVNDIIRNTFIVSEDKIQSLIQEIGKQFNVIEYKPQSTSMGYSGHLFKIWVKDGVKAEIQINTPQMIYAKEVNAKEILGSELFNKIRKETSLTSGLGHKYYEEYRNLSVSERQSAKGRELAEKSKAYYDAIKSVKL